MRCLRPLSATAAEGLRILDRALTTGDDYVVNAVAVSFVEQSAWWDPANADYIATWPAAPAAEAEGQRQWTPNRV